MAFAENLRRIRHRRGLTQEQLAHRMRVHTPRISELENGRCNPSIETLVLIAAALKTTPDNLLRGHKTKKKTR